MKGASLRILLSFTLMLLLQMSVLAAAFLPSVANAPVKHKKITVSESGLQILAEANENEEIDEDAAHFMSDMFVPMMELQFIRIFSELIDTQPTHPMYYGHPILANHRHLFCSVFII